MSKRSSSSVRGHSESLAIVNAASFTSAIERFFHFWPKVQKRQVDNNNNYYVSDGNSDHQHVINDIASKRIGSSLWLLIPLLFLLTLHGDGQILLDNYLPTTVFGLYVCGVSFVLVWIVRALLGDGRDDKGPADQSLQHLLGTKKSWVFVNNHRLPLLVLGIATIVRILLQLAFVQTPQCLVPGFEGVVPLLYTLWTSRGVLQARDVGPKSPKTGAYWSARQTTDMWCELQVSLLIGVATYLGSSMYFSPRSTIICEFPLLVRLGIYQYVAIGLDLFILRSAQKCLRGLLEMDVAPTSGISALAAMICFLAAPIVLIFSLILRLIPGFQVFNTLDFTFFKAFAWAVLLMVPTVLLVGRILSVEKIMALFSALSGVSVASSILSFVRNRDIITYKEYLQMALLVGVILYAFANDSRTRKVQFEWRTAAVHRSGYSTTVVVIAVATMAVSGLLSSSPYMELLSEHPIDNLIYSADKVHENWLMQAKKSTNFGEAVANYQSRYNRPPPPGFYTWYNFAIARNSDVIDDFDTIERDLAPFRALTPSELRKRVKQASDDVFNEIGVIKIRNGTAIVDQRFEGHYWMMDVLVLQIEYFLSSLPDMDIPFNINDDSRVVVSYDEMERLLANPPRIQAPTAARNWSTNTGDLLDEELSGERDAGFENWSFRNNFKKYSTIACAPNSAARLTKSWTNSRSCIWCAKPHLTAQFVEDWNSAGDPCHQPDLAQLHGFYQGSGSFKTTRRLIPIFSASKPQGYADILYPSIWSWDEGQRVRYKPTNDYPSPLYANKSNTLFWRGPTKEGFTEFGEWRTFLRQRFVHMNSLGKQSMQVYLPEREGSEKYRARSLTRGQFLQSAPMRKAGLDLDTRLTEFYQGWEDVPYQEQWVFGKEEENVDFQANWQHKFVMSLDEGSASKSFIPMVQSSSLPFRSTIFREWFDDRLVAWKHFVPIDVRLEGLWSTLAYFAGGFGSIRSTEGLDAGEFIAESGRHWGERALRKDDMEIYLFRLLLEWGRLLDDRRDEVGFEL